MSKAVIGFANNVSEAEKSALGSAASEESLLKQLIEIARADGTITRGEELAIAGQAAHAAAAQQGKSGYYTGSVSFEVSKPNGTWSWSFHGAPFAPPPIGPTPTVSYPKDAIQPGATHTLAPWEQLQKVALEVMKLEPKLSGFSAATLGTILGRASGLTVVDAKTPQTGGAKVFIPSSADLKHLASLKGKIDDAVDFVRGRIPEGALAAPKLIGNVLAVPSGSNLTFIARNVALEMGIDTVALAKSSKPEEKSRAYLVEDQLVKLIAAKNGISPNEVYAGQPIQIPDRAALDAQIHPLL